MPRRNIFQLYRDEFGNYNPAKFHRDLLAGLTVTAVSLPLALAFGVASGVSAAAGLVTAIVAGIVIGSLSGAPYQISGPTGAMSAVLVVLVQKYGLQGLWIAGLMSGIMLLMIGLLRLGRFIAFIPSPVITGFTAGIALLIFIGQIDNFLGSNTGAEGSAVLKFIHFFKGGFFANWYAIILGFIVILVMVLWPQKWNQRFPASLLGIILVTTLNMVLRWPVMEIGKIPQTFILAERFNLAAIHWGELPDFISPALTITALGAVESLLCGAVASNMTGIRLQANQELVGQGIGNILIPFFGGVPATAAIARTSVGIKSGGQTRLVSIIHALGIMFSMFLLAPVMAHVPLTALAGVLMVTAWRMNEWEGVRFIFKHRLKTAILAFLITMIATISLDLTKAILIGAFVSGVMFLNTIASLEVEITQVDPEKLRLKGIMTAGVCKHVRVAFLTGPLFFAATGNFQEAFSKFEPVHALILSMRGVPLVDASGLESIHHLVQKVQGQGGTLMLAGVHENVQRMLDRGGLTEIIGAENLFWSSDQAIVAAEGRECRFCK
jgi:SulP family sulfate permease